METTKSHKSEIASQATEYIARLPNTLVSFKCRLLLLNQLSHCLTHTPSLSQETHLNEAPNTTL